MQAISVYTKQGKNFFNEGWENLNEHGGMKKSTCCKTDALYLLCGLFRCKSVYTLLLPSLAMASSPVPVFLFLFHGFPLGPLVFRKYFF